MSGGVRRAGCVAGLVVAGFVAAVPGAVAQVLTGRVLEEGSAEPVEGALVALLDADSARVAAVLSGPGGRYSVRLPEGELFRVRVERIGYATVVTPPVARTRASREAVDVALPVEAVSLAPIVATGSGRCVVDPRTALETATLWDQARKALEVTALVQRDSLVRFRALRFARSLTPDRSVLLDETLHSGVMAGPFRSLSADSLASAGWVQAGGEESVYYMPDPEV
ncbi:MAG TPA: carboxypeptidase-like regulatory domain-containing protein, partial [Longimicrobiales bacterium]|nr:carboxypeptidase-like regulatory domain-containing protein [Longimicrobiales bacterium]